MDKPIAGLIHTVLDITEDIMAALTQQRPAVDLKQTLGALDRVLAGGERPSTAPPRVPDGQQEQAAFQPVDTLRVNAEYLDQVLRSTGRLASENLRFELIGERLSAVSAQAAAIEREWGHVRRHSAAALQRLSDVPECSRVVRFLNFVEHQARTISSQSRQLCLLHRQGTWSARNVTDQLQKDVRRARMVPAESIFEGFGKMVRDLARAEKKEITFQFTGSSIEADRMVLQSLKDPVMHMLRNAISHGLEPPEERKACGKDPSGHIHLRIETLNNSLRVVVDDDGRGINWRQVADTAARKGILDAAAAAKGTPQELARVLFKPGFSTAKFVTELSGRGMGLSIVAEAMTRLQGDVDVLHRPGPGAAIVMSVPLSISTHKLLVVSSQNQEYAIPLHGIERVALIKLKDIESVEGKSVVRMGSNTTQMVTLPQALGMGHSTVKVSGETVPVVILRVGQKRLTIAVDALLNHLDGMIQNLPPELSHLKTYSGCLMRGDGTVMLVLNPGELMETSQSSRHLQAISTVAPEAEVKQPYILVVDDSITTRTLEKSILEAHGYRVDVAVDGVEALNHLRSQQVDLVISDVQMPRLDGFGLLEEIKKDPRLLKIPLILVTSLESGADQERGLSLGADAYIVKRKFDQRNLLETIRQIL